MKMALMDLGPHMMRHQPDDPFAIAGIHMLARIGQSVRQAVHPKAASGVRHHLDHGWVVQKPQHRRARRGAQHPRAACPSIRF